MHLIARQPNGLFAIFSTDTSGFTHFNLTEIEAEIYSRETFHLSRHQVLDDIKMAKLAGLNGWRECMEIIERNHSAAALWDAEYAISLPRPYQIFLWLETAHGIVLQSAGVNSHEEANLWVEFQVQRLHLVRSRDTANAWMTGNSEAVYFFTTVNGNSSVML